MTHTQIGLLAIQSVASFAVLGYIWLERLRARRERQKYKLFGMRDRLLAMVAENLVSESDPLFILFYSTINKSIGEVRDLTLISFIKASIRAKHSLEEHEFAAMFDAATPDMREFTVAFASTWMEIMKANSVFLLLLVHIGIRGVKFIKSATSPRVFHTRLFQAQRQEVYTYQYFEELHNCHVT